MTKVGSKSRCELPMLDNFFPSKTADKSDKKTLK